MSQGLIRLKKVKVAPKRNLSIIKTSVYKKQLSVRFEDQKPIDTIKNLSQDIDQISHVIDSYFPSISQETHSSSIKAHQEAHSSSFHTSAMSTATKSSLLDSNQCFYCRHHLTGQLEKITELDQKSESKGLNEGWRKSEERGVEQESFRKYKNMAPAEAYGYDFRVVKKGRSFRPTLRITERQDGNENMDLTTPKIVKQSIPMKKPSKNRRRVVKDVVIAA